MLDKLRDALLYTGAGKQNLEMVKPKILESNRTTVSLLSCCATILIAIMFISTFFVEGVMANRRVYLIGMIVSLIVCIYAFTVAKKHAWMIMPLVYIVYFIFYLYGILIGTITDPNQKTVTFIAMLVFLPVLFTDTPIHQIETAVLYIAIFIILCLHHKTGVVLQNDVIDAIIFGTLGLISGIITSNIKVRGYMLALELQRISRTDELTQMNNRNCYENCLEQLYDRPKISITCIYIDVNGLHELNNKKGHAEGDEMLKFIAIQIKEFFGKDMSFRIGGDEFVIFAIDEAIEKLKKDLKNMTSIIENAGYHVAVGIEHAYAQHLSMYALVSSAESRMYQDKEKFYQDYSHDRRKITRFRGKPTRTRV